MRTSAVAASILFAAGSASAQGSLPDLTPAPDLTASIEDRIVVTAAYDSMAAAHRLYEEFRQAVRDGKDALAEEKIEAAWRTARAYRRDHPDTSLFAFLLAQTRIINGDINGARDAAEFAMRTAFSAQQHYTETEARILYGATLTDSDPVRARAELEEGFGAWDAEIEQLLGQGAPQYDIEYLDVLYRSDRAENTRTFWISLASRAAERRAANIGPRQDIIAARLQLAALQAAAGDMTEAGRSSSFAIYDLIADQAAPQTSWPRAGQYFLQAAQIAYLAGLYQRALAAFALSSASWNPQAGNSFERPEPFIAPGQIAPGLAAALAWLTLTEETIRAQELDFDFDEATSQRIIVRIRDCNFRWAPRAPLALALGDTARIGAVTLVFDFDEHGAVTNPRIAASAPAASPEAEAAILAAAATWHARFTTPFGVPDRCRTNQLETTAYYY